MYTFKRIVSVLASVLVMASAGAAGSAMAADALASDALASDGGIWGLSKAGTCKLDGLGVIDGGEVLMYYDQKDAPDGVAFYSFENNVLSTDGIGPSNDESPYVPKFLGGALKDDGTLFVVHVYTTRAEPATELRETCTFVKYPQ